MLSVLSLTLVLSAIGSPAPREGADDYWPRWRGPLATGEAPGARPPLEWSEERNVRWKVEIPGRGKSSPIVWGEHVFVLTAVPALADGEEGDGVTESGSGFMRKIDAGAEQRFTVMALNRGDGSTAWSHVARQALPHEGTHGDGSWASSSAVTDGVRLIAHFGSNGLFAYDLEGNQLWEVQLGKMETRKGFGEGSSPALHGDTVVVQWDHEGPSFVVALDASTGKEKWRQERDEPTSWATPLVVEVEGRPQVVTAGTNRIRAYDLETGALLWDCAGLTLNAIPSPVQANGTAYLMSGFQGNQLRAIRLAGAKGDITDTENVLWEHDKDTPYVPSPLLVGGVLYFTKSNSGILTAFDVESGEALYGPERLETVENVYASPVAAAGRIYVASRDGVVEVLALGAEHEVLASNTLDESFDASPALAGGELYLRGARSLYCIAEE